MFGGGGLSTVWCLPLKSAALERGEGSPPPGSTTWGLSDGNFIEPLRHQWLNVI